MADVCKMRNGANANCLSVVGQNHSMEQGIKEDERSESKNFRDQKRLRFDSHPNGPSGFFHSPHAGYIELMFFSNKSILSWRRSLLETMGKRTAAHRPSSHLHIDFLIELQTNKKKTEHSLATGVRKRINLVVLLTSLHMYALVLLPTVEICASTVVSLNDIFFVGHFRTTHTHTHCGERESWRRPKRMAIDEA